MPSPAPGAPELGALGAPEFTCVCPRTGQPDFARLRIGYVPGEKIIGLKSLKLYLWSWRDEGVFHEAVVNRVLEDLAAACAPAWMRVRGVFNVRGGITTSVTASRGERPAGLAGGGEGE